MMIFLLNLEVSNKFPPQPTKLIKIHVTKPAKNKIQEIFRKVIESDRVKLFKLN